MKFKTSHAKLSTAHGLISRLFIAALAFSLLVMPFKTTARAQASPAPLSKPQLVSNTKKYRNTGLPPSQGRSGSATLTARALLGKDGQTGIEMTTGTLDDATTAPGNIIKAQLKPINNNGEAIYARNYKGLSGGGRFAVTVNDLRRAQQVQVQANVSGIDPARTDVVTVVETVKLRPDLSALKLVAPAQSVANTSVNFSTVIRELNGDIGAKANVVLYVDGSAVDRADGIWVDANGTVSAAFTHTFTSEGVKRLEVKVEQVVPGDYNPADNSATASIEIVPPSVKLSYSAYFGDRNMDSKYDSDYEYSYKDENITTADASTYAYHNRSHTQDVNFYGWSYHSAIGFPVDASITELSDGAAVHSATFSGMNPDYTYSSDYGSYKYTSSSLYRQDYTSGYYFYLTSYSVADAESGYKSDFTQVSYTRHAGDVTYHSASTYRSYYAYQGEVAYDYAYSYNYDYSDKGGFFAPVGAEYGLNVSLSGADGVLLEAAPRMPIVPTDYNFSSNFCWNYSYEFASGRNCYQDTYSYQAKDGSAYEYND